MKEQVMNVAKAVDLSIAYANQGLEVKVCVFDIIIHVSFCTENVHVSFDKRPYKKIMQQNVNKISKNACYFLKGGVQ